MKITLNDNTIDIPDNFTAQELISKYGENTSAAVAINSTIVKKDFLHTTALAPNDNVIIIQAVYGG
jgi:thiamine biosynthesis protein ThiS